MATGIVSAALHQAGQPSLSAALLVIAVAVFVILVAASAVPVVAFPASLRADAGRPDWAFTWFAFVAACGVLRDRLASGGYRLAAVMLAGIVRIPGALARAAITGLAVSLWSIAIVLIPPLATATAARYLRRPVRLRYRGDMWTVVFPLGMYAMAGLHLGTAARLPLVYHIGAVAVPCATAAWALTFIGLATSPLDHRHDSQVRAEIASRYDIRKREPPGPGARQAHAGR